MFSIPKPQAPLALPKPPGPSARGEPPPIARAGQTVPRGEAVEIPERGKISLRSLSNGTAVWVVHHADGSLNVLASVVLAKHAPRTELPPFVWQTISYSPDQGRFVGGYDARGKSVHGWAPIQAFSWTRIDEHQLALGRAVATVPAPVQAADAAPSLDGPARAYAGLPTQDWASVTDGRIALLDADLVVRDQGVAELCQAPDPSAPLKFFAECPAGSPWVLGSPSNKPPHMRAHVLYGPLVVQRHRQAASVILTAPPRMRSLPPPVKSPCPLRSRSGQYPGYRVEWTHKDGPDVHRELCDPHGTLIILHSAILRGSGSERVGAALRHELEPRLAAIVPTSWSRGCNGDVEITLKGKHPECRLDAVIQKLGEYLRERNASDRIILRLPLRGAGAISREPWQ